MVIIKVFYGIRCSKVKKVKFPSSDTVCRLLLIEEYQVDCRVTTSVIGCSSLEQQPKITFGERYRTLVNIQCRITPSMYDNLRTVIVYGNEILKYIYSTLEVFTPYANFTRYLHSMMNNTRVCLIHNVYYVIPCPRSGVQVNQID